MKKDLSLIPIQDLYKELLGRFDHAVFMGKNMCGESTKVSRRYKGDHHIAMGLCSDCIHDINLRIIEEEETIGPEDL